jgi:hypothetical protein
LTSAAALLDDRFERPPGPARESAPRKARQI